MRRRRGPDRPERHRAYAERQQSFPYARKGGIDIVSVAAVADNDVIGADGGLSWPTMRTDGSIASTSPATP